jgi:hypothetical protein
MAPYVPSYTAGQVAGMPADIAGTALVAGKAYVPLFVGGLVGIGLYKHFKTKGKQWKVQAKKSHTARPYKKLTQVRYKKMTKAQLRNFKPWGIF